MRKILCDESIPLEAVDLLVGNGQAADHIFNSQYRGLRDHTLHVVCNMEQITLLTAIKDFDNPAYWPVDEIGSLIVVQAKSMARRNVLDLLGRAIPNLLALFRGNGICSVYENQLHIRHGSYTTLADSYKVKLEKFQQKPHNYGGLEDSAGS